MNEDFIRIFKVEAALHTFFFIKIRKLDTTSLPKTKQKIWNNMLEWHAIIFLGIVDIIEVWRYSEENTSQKVLSLFKLMLHLDHQYKSFHFLFFS